MGLGELNTERRNEDIVLICATNKGDIWAALCLPFAFLPVYLIYAYFIDKTVWNPIYEFAPLLFLLVIFIPQPVVILRGDEKRIEVFRNIKTKAKGFFKDVKTKRVSSALATEDILKFEVFQFPVPEGSEVPTIYTFRIFIKDGPELITIPYNWVFIIPEIFRFDQ